MTSPSPNSVSDGVPTDFFAYGSLMLPQVLRAVTGNVFPHVAAVLSDHARYRLRGQSYPGIVTQSGASTDGVVYRALDAGAFARLDAFEGPWYRRVAVCVETAEGAESAAWTYRIADDQRHRLTAEPWSLERFREACLDEFLGEYPGFERAE